MLERRLQSAERLAELGWWERYPDDQRVVWSAGMRALFGVQPEFIASREAFERFVHPDDRWVVAATAQLPADGVADEYEFRISRADGEVRRLQLRRGVRRHPDGTVEAIHGVMRDVTELRAAEDRNREAQEALATAFQQAPVGMAIVGLDGRCQRVNPALCRLLVSDEAAMVARAVRDIVHPDDPAVDERELRQLLAGETTSYRVEKRCLTTTGDVLWTDASVSLARRSDGAPDYLIIQVQDITARKLAEERLRRAEQQLRIERDQATTIITAMHDGYALTIDGEIKAVNRAWCQMIGYSETELIGIRPPYPFWVPEELDETEALRRRITAAGGGSFQLTFQRRDGTRFEAEIAATPALDADGAPVGFVNTLRDVSEVNRDRRELERMARTDSLTGLANRFVLEQSLAHEAGHRVDDRGLALVLLDLDRFKQVNDAYGHPVGDAVLVEVAERLSRTVRTGEVLARVGGEEFAWLLPASGLREAVAAADRARAAIACRPFRGAGALTMSAGVGVVDVPFDTELLYRLADRALYDAKQQGRNRTCHQLCGEPTASRGPGRATSEPTVLVAETKPSWTA